MDRWKGGDRNRVSDRARPNWSGKAPAGKCSITAPLVCRNFAQLYIVAHGSITLPSILHCLFLKRNFFLPLFVDAAAEQSKILYFLLFT